VALLRAGMAEIVIGEKTDVLQALGLGSCIGLLAYDRLSQIAGLAHIMLPDSGASRDGVVIKGKFADTALPELLDQLARRGVVKGRLTIKIAGGAEMFTFAGSDSPKLAVGARNAAAVLSELAKAGLRVAAQDTGANHGRTMEFDISTQICTIKAIGKPPKEL
jgi:chemotaxis protein CheD